MGSDKSEAGNCEQMRMEVDEKIKAQSERKHLKFPLCARVHVFSLDEILPEKNPPKASRLQNRCGRQITGETKLTSEGKK